jgi:mono/diheme cytochrome c family protein
MKTYLRRLGRAATIAGLVGACAGGSRCHAGGVRSITLPHFEAEAPFAPGRDEFLVACESCHSSRYIAMQPPFPERKWEEIVTKMAKVFGAQIDDEQKKAIVGYLVAIKGNAPKMAKAGLASADDEAESALVPALAPRAETIPLLAVATNASELAADLSRGAELFKQDCAACHGAEGRGDGVVAAALLRKPEDLTASTFSMEALGRALWNGSRGTAMPSWRALSTNDLRAVAAYAQTLHPVSKLATAATAPPERAKPLFQQNCAPCHGPTGDGNSAVAATLAPAPANFKSKQPDFDLIMRVTRDGIAGTSMPSWNDKLPDSDRAALANFVRSLFEQGGTGEK